MEIFDENVREILKYTAALYSSEVKRNLLVKLIKYQAKYYQDDLYLKYYTEPYDKENLRDENDVCNYLILLPLLKQLYNKESADSHMAFTKIGKKPSSNDISEIKKRLE